MNHLERIVAGAAQYPHLENGYGLWQTLQFEPLAQQEVEDYRHRLNIYSLFKYKHAYLA